jgi:malate dehydrogenase (quinone)
MECDVLVVGLGVSGGAFAFALKFTNIRNVVVLEKNPAPALVNSDPMNNAQTSHEGDTETNYGLKKALAVRQAAVYLRRYVDSKNDRTLSRKTTRMVLASGPEKVRQLEVRFREFGAYYPHLSLIGPKELLEREPKVMEGRPPDQPVAALMSTEGYAINYQRLTQHFLEDALASNSEMRVFMNTEVRKVARDEGGFVVETNHSTLRARVVVFEAGAYSLHFAHMLGYGRQYAILSVAGSFYSGGRLLNGKVYQPQIENIPFAAIHGDADLLNPEDTRFGPTTKPLPLMERHRYRTAWDWVRLGLFSPRGVRAVVKVLWKNKLIGYVIKNWIFDLPAVGKWFFLREVRPIVPTIRGRDLRLRRGAGGIRPQIIDLEKGELIMGDATLVGDRCIFNTTPSPGASVCLANARRDVAAAVRFLGDGFRFDPEAFDRELGGAENRPAG